MLLSVSGEFFFFFSSVSDHELLSKKYFLNYEKVTLLSRLY